jgi:formylglycine-generating enzyme required for sulfatase activity
MTQTRPALFISHSSKDKAWAERLHDALVADGYGAFLDSHPDDGIHPGADWEKLLWLRLRQCGGVVVLCSANWLKSPWCVAEAMLAREHGKKIFLLGTREVINGRQVKGGDGAQDAPQIPDFLKPKQCLPVAGLSPEEAYRRLQRGLAEEKLNEEFAVLGPPYPGLEPFQERDAAVFFGRRDKIEQVKNVLNQRRRNNAPGFIVVLGASGCGKSSLVRAGVLPRLRRAGEENDAGAEWVIVPPFFGREGLEGLASRLDAAFEATANPQEPDSIIERLDAANEQDSGTKHAAKELRKLCRNLLRAHGLWDAHVLLVLDQLEEVFAIKPGSDARALLRLLLDVSAHPASRVVVLATMRSDFLDAFQQFEGAADRYEKITLDPMQKERFAEIIEGPAHRCGLKLGPGLSQRMVEDTKYADALPLLAFTLKELYEKGGADNLLTLEEYEGLFPPVEMLAEDGSKTTEKGVAAAIKHVADTIVETSDFAGLKRDDPRMRHLRSAFFRLAEVGPEGQFTRRTARREDVATSDAVARVLEKFEKQRLLVPGVDAVGAPTLGVAHEALFRVWDTLRGWLEDDRKALALRAQIEEAAAWTAETRPEIQPDLVWPEGRIIDAVTEITWSGVSLDDVNDRATVDAFIGPIDPDEIVELLSLMDNHDETSGSGRYGDAWRLPLGHEARAGAGDRLALLGDGRKGVGLRADGLPDIDWVPIGGGEVTIRILNDPLDETKGIKERTGTVPFFWMARYPVTVTQFQAFVADCYRDGAWIPELQDLFGSNYEPPKHRARYGNHPADSVNWYDAFIFCAWLGWRLPDCDGIRLPTEFEWQRAATGGDPTRTYPWGAEWDPKVEPWRANTAESALGRSTAVGMYPAGASPMDVLDIAGTIYEWCQNDFADPDDIAFPKSPQAPRVLRGGSWSVNRDGARSADRLRGYPLDRINFFSFRVVCSSPSSGH